ncbi:MAG TPA: hypothetical protein VI542_20910 [Candidatus Tectomicrobia bacterium]
MAQEVIQKYIESGQPWPATSRQMAEWAIQHNQWIPHPARLVNLCADQLARAMSEEYITDPQGRRVRAKHVVRIEHGGKQLYLWDDFRTADHTHMEIAFQQRRCQIVADCLQLKSDMNSYNENRKPARPIQLIFDFTDDLTELELASV